MIQKRRTEKNIGIKGRIRCCGTKGYGLERYRMKLELLCQPQTQDKNNTKPNTSFLVLRCVVEVYLEVQYFLLCIYLADYIIFGTTLCSVVEVE